jgi:hypothetical protein
MASTRPRIRQIDFKLDDDVRYDWEVLADGTRYAHEVGQSLRDGWVRLKSGRAFEIRNPKIVKSLTHVARKRRLKYPNGRATRTSDGIIHLSYKGCIWKRGTFFLDGTSEPSKEWSRLVLKEFGEEWRPVKRKHWDRLTEYASQLLAAVTDTDVRTTGDSLDPRPYTNAPDPQERARQKRTKHGVKIFSSDDIHYFEFGCWRSKKYPGRFSIRLAVAGKRMTYTIRRSDMDALQWELQRLLPVQTAAPQIVPSHTDANLLSRVQTA